MSDTVATVPSEVQMWSFAMQQCFRMLSGAYWYNAYYAWHPTLRWLLETLQDDAGPTLGAASTFSHSNSGTRTNQPFLGDSLF